MSEDLLLTGNVLTKMKYIVILLLTVLSLKIFPQEIFKVINTTDQFSIEIPENWISISRDELKNISENNYIMKKKARIYTYGYEKQNITENYYPPGVLIFIDNCGRLDEQEISEFDDLSKLKDDYKPGDNEEILISLLKRVNEFYIYDSINNIIWLYVNLGQASELQTITALKLTRTGIIQLDFGCLKEEFLDYLPVFIKISERLVLEKNILY